MRYLTILLEGGLTRPSGAGKTPLETADTSTLDRLARRGRVGAVRLLPEERRLPAEAIYLSVLGYDPENYTGRGAVLAAARRIPLGEREVACAAPLVSTDGTTLFSDGTEGISDEESVALLDAVSEKLGSSRMALYPAPGNHGFAVFADLPGSVLARSPQRCVGKTLRECLPEGEAAEKLTGLMFDSLEILDRHPTNRQRRGRGQSPLNMIWPYGPGRSLSLPPLFDRIGPAAAVTDRALAAGIARAAGLRVVAPPAPGYAAVVAAVREAQKADVPSLFVPVRIVAPDENPENEEHAERIEQVDRDLVEPLLSRFERGDEAFRCLVIATPPVPGADPVPFLIYDPIRPENPVLPFDERALPEIRAVLDGRRMVDSLTR
ncbi:MAG: hypothetical protein SFU56_07345 [Capsulimonadales bacterium]|nr:hypothetical protein [Capsulimonadales bacterium]